MKWNYRTIRHVGDNGVYHEIHQTFYNEEDIPVSYNKHPILLQGDDFPAIWYHLQEIKSSIGHYSNLRSQIYGELDGTTLKEASWQEISKTISDDSGPQLTGGGGNVGASPYNYGENL